jgi:hypothetical protein
MQYMIIETFVHGAEPVYARFRERGRMAPAGLEYLGSVVSVDGRRCFQIMACNEQSLLASWMDKWRDLVSFEVVPVMSSAEAATHFGPADPPLADHNETA